MSENAAVSKKPSSSSYAPGTSGHSAESTISRSASSTSCRNWSVANGGRPRQRRKTGRSASRSGVAMLAGAWLRGASEAELDHFVAELPDVVLERIALEIDAGGEAVRLVRLREEEERPGRVAGRPARQASPSRPRAIRRGPRPCASARSFADPGDPRPRHGSAGRRAHLRSRRSSCTRPPSPRHGSLIGATRRAPARPAGPQVPAG